MSTEASLIAGVLQTVDALGLGQQQRGGPVGGGLRVPTRHLPLVPRVVQAVDTLGLCQHQRGGPEKWYGIYVSIDRIEKVIYYDL